MGKVAQGLHSVAFARATRSAVEGNSGTTVINHEVYRTNSVGSVTAR